MRNRAEDYPIDVAKSDIHPLMYSAVGGSTIMWSCHAPRFHPSDFAIRTLDGVGDDWPIRYQDLEPFYDLNESISGVAGLNGDPAYPDSKSRGYPHSPLGWAQRKLPLRSTIWGGTGGPLTCRSTRLPTEQEGHLQPLRAV